MLQQAGPLTAGDLAERMGPTTGAMTGVIDRLKRAGLARRARDPNDRQCVVALARGKASDTSWRSTPPRSRSSPFL
jgi:DNA-binding MarR family transcriptional regulator